MTLSRNVSAFLASLLYYIGPEAAATTEADAAATIEQWRTDGAPVPGDLTPSALARFYRENAPRE